MKKQPDFVFDIKIDLHGRTTMQAFHTVLQTIESAYKNGERNILFVTGIGDEAVGTGAIRREFPIYLDHPRVRDFILSAKYENGKYLVRLRRRPPC